MKRKYFGTDGIRGTVGQHPITPDFMLRLGNAIGHVLRKTQGLDRPQICIGKDTRISGYMIESALEAGFISAGVDVALTGPLPTPGIAYLTRAMRLDMGVVISASHNPFEDNGVKFFAADGRKFSDEWELEVERLLENEMVFVGSNELGKAIRIDDAQGRYIEFCKSTIDIGLSLKGLKIVVDGANGAAYHTAKSVFHELGAEVVCVACAPDGFNINDGVGATHSEFISKKTREYQADYGIALDGDADRLIMVDADGRVFDGDELLYIIVKDRVTSGKKVPGVVGTLMTNLAIELAIKEQGIEFVRANVGDRYILEELAKRKWELGGESSGHLLDLSRHTTGDGTISALLVLQAIARNGAGMKDLLGKLKLYPQSMINVKITKGQDWSTPALEVAKRNVEDEFTRVWGEGKGRILIRPSGTEPVVRVMVECPSALTGRQASEYLAKTITDAHQI